MNINLVYQGNTFNFDLRRDVNIKYIQDLATKLISKDISNFHLLYKNKNLSDYPETTLFKDLIKDDNKISIIITLKENNNILSSEKKPKLNNKDLDLSKNSSNITNSKLMLNTPLVSPINSQKRNQSLNQQLSNNIFNKKQTEYISKNKVFEEVYNLKENEIYSLMQNLSQKIKEYDAILYKHFKNNKKCESSLYERSIIDYKDKQIKFLKKLLNYFDTNEKDFASGAIPLTEFYKDLKQYNSPKTIILYNNTDYSKSNNINNNKKKLSKTDSKIKLDESNNIRNQNQNKKLPLLPNSKSNNNKRYFLSQNNNTISSVESNENNSNIIKEQQFFKDHIFNSENKPNKNKNVIKKNVINKKDNKEKEININNCNNNINTKKSNNNNLTDNKNKNNNFNKAISLCNTNDQTTTSQSTTMQGKVVITNIINNNSNKNQMIKNILNKSSKNKTNQKLITLNNKKNNKMSVLLEEENKFDNISNNNSCSSELSNKTSKRKFSSDSKNNNDLSKNGEENNYVFRKTKRNKKMKGKNKKIANNIYDFLI